MKILLFITGLGMGGAERQIVNLADAFVSEGHQVLLVYLGGDVVLRPVQPTVRVEGLGVTKRTWTLVGAWRSLGKLIREFRPDVVHSHLVHANIFARLVRLTTPMPCLVSSAHNTNEEGWWRMLAYRLTERLADVTTNVSREAVEAFERGHAVARGDMRIVPNGIPIGTFRFDAEARRRVRAVFGVGENIQLIVAVGRLSPPKDYPNLIHAIKQLTSLRDDFRVVVAGEGRLQESLQALAAKEGLGDGLISFVGMYRDTPALLSAADIFVLSSAWEGFSLVVAEAMACERPVVATDCGGVREVLGEEGFLVRSRDELLLAGALDRALALDADERITLGRSARQRVVDMYSMERATCRWLEIYEECVSPNRKQQEPT